MAAAELAGTNGSSADSDIQSPLFALTSPSEFLAPCPKFRILVLGNPESTKQELFSKIFGVDLEKKLVADAFSASHDIEQELDLEGKNGRLTVYTSPNFGSDDRATYQRVCDFLASRSSDTQQLQERIHCIWYCVASEEERLVSQQETRFFGGGLATVAPQVPVVLVFTKYDEFVGRVQLAWSRDAQERGLSKVALSYILRDLSTKRFYELIGKRWDDVLLDGQGRSRVRHVPRVCVSSGAVDGDDDDSSFEALAKVTLESLREWKERHVKLAFAAAQRSSVTISTRYCADTAAEYFTVDTGHVRKADGIAMRDIVPNFFAKAVKIFNLRDNAAALDDASLLGKVLEVTFGSDKRLFLDEILHSSSTDSGMLFTLSPHERAVMLTQALAAIVMFLDKLADTQWPHRNAFLPTITPRTIERELDEIRSGREKQELLETVEASPIFSSCHLKNDIADLVLKTVEMAERISLPQGRDASGVIVVDDDSELREISLSFVNDKSPDDMVLPCGMTILRLN
ncbi:hypothetical protein B0T25DRAFT_560968 [Lasiosphaeria hispida]|uniref:G domain-containing protein n=1 Tax=Lasiosphaeria hispida TaxID=260671 RepID=A0AAJ0H5D8_9PEZI|nr:hypothetical protein B0T25DRAFT_560968 [Lasiosphaeria hispida]